MKTLFEKQSVEYCQAGDYKIPNVVLSDQKEYYIGVWANRHRQYLKQHHRIRYYNLLTTERLYPYLADIEEQAQTMFSQLVKSFAEKENITEKLKSDNPKSNSHDREPLQLLHFLRFAHGCVIIIS